MTKTIELANGQFVSMIIAEVISVPYFELYSKNVDKANYENQVLFTQVLASIHRKWNLEKTAYELLWHSIEVHNQTYKAQVKFYIIIRRIGKSAVELEYQVQNIFNGIKLDLESKNFVVSVLDSDEEYDTFKKSLEEVNTSTVLSVAKKEKAVQSAAFKNGFVYYNETLDVSENINTSSISDALTQYPNSAISMQIIPTEYADYELYAIEQSKLFLNHYTANIRYGQGMRIDANTQMIVDAYDYYSNANNELLFTYNFVVYSDRYNAADLASKVANALEIEGKATGSAFDAVDVSDFGLAPANKIFANPWLVRDVLIYKARDDRFWNNKTAPTHLIRLKYLMTAVEIRSTFKLPIDDGKAIGLESKKVLKNREKLDKSIISENNFKVGVLQNTSKSDHKKQIHAGLALKDFTKHGLIVGMPGSGKTVFSLGILLQFWKEFKIPFLAIEPTKSEYRSLIDEIDDLQIFTPGKSNISPYIINPFIPPTGVSVESYIPSLMTAFKAAFSMPNPLPDIFLAAINDSYNEYGWKMNSTVTDEGVQKFGLYEFIKVFKKNLKQLNYKGDVKANIESAGVVRLISLIEQNSNIYDTVNTIPLEDLLKRPTVIELNAINNKEQKSLIMALLLILICVYTKNNIAGDGMLKNVILIDEAHVLLSRSTTKNEDSADSQGSTIEALEDMIAEIRSYGTGIIIADQSPTKVGRNIIANTNVKVIFKLVEKENKDAISTATNMNDADYDLLGRLSVGEALLHYGKVYNPLHIKTYNVLEQANMRSVISDNEIAQTTTYWNNRPELLIPYIECRYNSECEHNCNFETRETADFIATRLKNHYLHDLKDRTAFIKFLVRMDKPVAKILNEYPNIQFGMRMMNCIKIKFLRKSLLQNDYEISKKDYDTILKHPNFIKRDYKEVL